MAKAATTAPAKPTAFPLMCDAAPVFTEGAALPDPVGVEMLDEAEGKLEGEVAVLEEGVEVAEAAEAADWAEVAEEPEAAGVAEEAPVLELLQTTLEGTVTPALSTKISVSDSILRPDLETCHERKTYVWQRFCAN